MLEEEIISNCFTYKFENETRGKQLHEMSECINRSEEKGNQTDRRMRQNGRREDERALERKSEYLKRRR